MASSFSYLPNIRHDQDSDFSTYLIWIGPISLASRGSDRFPSFDNGVVAVLSPPLFFDDLALDIGIYATNLPDPLYSFSRLGIHSAGR